MHRLTDAFWGVPGEPTLGVRKLHAKLLQDISQIEELYTFIGQRIAIEDMYAGKLIELGRKAVSSGNGSDESAVSSIFSSYKKELVSIAQPHKSISEVLLELNTTIHQHIDTVKRTCFTKKDEVDSIMKKLDAALTTMQQLHRVYHDKTQQSVAEIKKHESGTQSGKNGSGPSGVGSSLSDDVPVMDIMVNMGPLAFTVDEFNDLLARMYRYVPSHDIRSLLGTYKECVDGTALMDYVCKCVRVLMRHGSQSVANMDISDSIDNINSRPSLNQEQSEDDATITTAATSFLNDLISNNFIRPVSSRSTQFSPSISYQWKRYAYEAVDEPLHKRLSRDAARAGHDYQRSIQQVNDLRQQLNISCYDYMRNVETCMRDRFSVIKSCITKCLDAESMIVTPIQRVRDTVTVFLETLDTEKEIHAVVERYRTGVVPMQPVVFVDSTSGSPSTDIFGVALDTLTARTGARVPPFLRICSKHVHDEFVKIATEKLPKSSPDAIEKLAYEMELEAWISPYMDLESVYKLRSVLNRTSNPRLHHISSYAPEIVIHAIKIFLTDLPTSLCSDEIYDPTKLLYLSKTEESGAMMRVNSLRSLIATMSTSHLNTLAFLVGSWRRMCIAVDASLSQSVSGAHDTTGSPSSPQSPSTLITDHRIITLASTLGHIILRPSTETSVTINDKHRERVLRDLIVFYSDLMSEGIISPASSDEDLLGRVENDGDESSDDDVKDSRVFGIGGTVHLEKIQIPTATENSAAAAGPTTASTVQSIMQSSSWFTGGGTSTTTESAPSASTASAMSPMSTVSQVESVAGESIQAITGAMDSMFRKVSSTSSSWFLGSGDIRSVFGGMGGGTKTSSDASIPAAPTVDTSDAVAQEVTKTIFASHEASSSSTTKETNSPLPKPTAFAPKPDSITTKPDAVLPPPKSVTTPLKPVTTLPIPPSPTKQDAPETTEQKPPSPIKQDAPETTEQKPPSPIKQSTSSPIKPKTPSPTTPKPKTPSPTTPKPKTPSPTTPKPENPSPTTPKSETSSKLVPPQLQPQSSMSSVSLSTNTSIDVIQTLKPDDANGPESVLSDESDIEVYARPPSPDRMAQ